MNPIPLSVFDPSPLPPDSSAVEAVGQTLHLARLCEAVGYQRFWVGEQHASQAMTGCAPEVLLARLGADTRRIRIGSAGLRLNHYSPYKVAEVFKLLETLYPDRIDAGVSRSDSQDPAVDAALDYGSRTANPDYFPRKLADLEALLRDESPRTRGMERLRALPATRHTPHLWLTGTTEGSARLAARHGLPFNLNLLLNPHVREQSLQIYRDNFQPGRVLDRPHTCLVVFAVCADTEAEAWRLCLSYAVWLLLGKEAGKGARDPLPAKVEAEQVSFTETQRALLKEYAVVGDPGQVTSGLQAMAGRFHADELMLVTVTHGFEARCRSYQMLAEAWQE